MARRRRAPRKKRVGPGHNEANRRTSESRQRARMLDAGIEHRFRYFAEQVFQEKSIEPEVWRPLLQQIWTRGARQGIDEAREYVKERVDEGHLDKDLADRLLELIRRHSTVR